MFYVRPSRCELIETTAVVQSQEHPVLHGTVVNADGKPVADAVAVLYASGGAQPDVIAGVTVTDAFGHFVFGPLEAGILYQVSIHADTMQRRILEQPPADGTD